MLDETTVDSYIAARYMQLLCDSYAGHAGCTCLGTTLSYLAFKRLLFLKDSSNLLIYPIIPLIKPLIYILPYLNTF